MVDHWLVLEHVGLVIRRVDIEEEIDFEEE